MKKFEAKCLEEAYELATNEFNCSITDLNIDIIQQSSKGFLGIGKKVPLLWQNKNEIAEESSEEEIQNTEKTV